MMLILTALIAGCSSATPTPAPEAPGPPSTPAAPRLEGLRLERVLTGTVYSAPTNLVQSGAGPMLFSEQSGRIGIFDEQHLTEEGGYANELLDLRDQASSRGSEEGLLGLALPPDDAPYLYVYYSASNPRRSVVSRFDFSLVNRQASIDSELVILEVPQPYSNHNGGQIAFGPDGYLYIGLGDGGSAGDPEGNGQDTSTLLGSILRIDVSGATAERPYAIPPDNPLRRRRRTTGDMGLRPAQSVALFLRPRDRRAVGRRRGPEPVGGN